MIIAAIRFHDTKHFQGVFWARNLHELWTAVDEIGPPHEFDYLRLSTFGGVFPPANETITFNGGDEEDAVDTVAMSPTGCALEDMETGKWKRFCTASQHFANGV